MGPWNADDHGFWVGPERKKLGGIKLRSQFAKNWNKAENFISRVKEFWRLEYTTLATFFYFPPPLSLSLSLVWGQWLWVKRSKSMKNGETLALHQTCISPDSQFLYCSLPAKLRGNSFARLSGMPKLPFYLLFFFYTGLFIYLPEHQFILRSN